MKRMMIVTLSLIMVLSALAVADAIGAFSAFKSSIGARALAMGEAFVAMAESRGSLWDPAGIELLNISRRSMLGSPSRMALMESYFGNNGQFEAVSSLAVASAVQGSSLTIIGSDGRLLHALDLFAEDNRALVGGPFVLILFTENFELDLIANDFVNFEMVMLAHAEAVALTNIDGMVIELDDSAFRQLAFESRFANLDGLVAHYFDPNDVDDFKLATAYIATQIVDIALDFPSITGGAGESPVELIAFTIGLGSDVNVAIVANVANVIGGLIDRAAGDTYADQLSVLSAEFSLGGLLGED